MEALAIALIVALVLTAWSMGVTKKVHKVRSRVIVAQDDLIRSTILYEWLGEELVRGLSIHEISIKSTCSINTAKEILERLESIGDVERWNHSHLYWALTPQGCKKALDSCTFDPWAMWEKTKNSQETYRFFVPNSQG